MVWMHQMKKRYPCKHSCIPVVRLSSIALVGNRLVVSWRIVGVPGDNHLLSCIRLWWVDTFGPWEREREILLKLMLKEILTSALVRDRCCRPGLVGPALDREGVVEWAIIKDKLLAKSCTPIPAIGTKIQNIVATNTANPAARKNKQLKTKQKSQWLMILFEKNNGCEWLVNCCIFALLELQRASLIQCIIAYLLCLL